MKTLALIFLLCSPVKAALPDVITDPAIRDVVEYLDVKISSTIGPRGPQGVKGDTGATGDTGPAGATGATGAAATIAIGTTTTVSSTTAAAVYNTGTSSAAIIGFNIPRGADGLQGAQGIQGPQGIPGASDNLGSHIATMTITANYGISASTITTTQVITTSSDVVAHAYYGDGSHLSGLAGTGDVVLAATQTFTGANTFTGSVTVSSLTVASPTGLMISTFSATSNGFTYLPGGLLMQWGSISIAANSTATSSFPKTFSAACYSLTAVHGPQAAWQNYNVFVAGPGGINIVSTSQFQISNLDDSTVTYYWQAIGY